MEDNQADLQTLKFQEVLVKLSRDEWLDLSDRMQRFCAIAADMLNVARVSIWLFNDSHRELHCINLYNRSVGTHESGTILDVGQYPRYFDTLEQCRTIASEDARNDPATAEFASGYLDTFGITSMLDVPIRREGQTVGVLCNEQVGPQRQWRAAEQNFAASLSDLIALACETDRRRQYNQRLKLLRDVDRAILSVRSVEEIAEAALGRFQELVPCDRASVAVFERDAGIVRIVGVIASGATQLGKGSEVPLGFFGDQNDLMQGMPYIIADIERIPDSPVKRALEAERIRSSLSVPLLSGDEFIGTLSLGSRNYDAFQPGHVEIAQEVADGLAVAIRHAHLNQISARYAAELEQRVKERTAELSETNARLRESEERVRALYNNTPIMMESIDERGNVLDVNEFWLKTLGYERSEVIGQPITNFAAPEYRRLVQEELLPRLTRDGVLKDVEVQAITRTGERVDVQVSSVLKRDPDGRFRHSQAFLMDITERKRAEKDRREIEERLSGIFRSAMDAIVVTDSERRIVIFNDAAETVFRCPASEAVGKPIGVFLSAQLEEVLTGYMATANSRNAPQLWLPDGLQAVRKTGERFLIEATVSQTQVSTGTLFTIILRDIDDRKRAEARLDQLQLENLYLQEELQTEFEEIVGVSAAIQSVYASIEMVANTDSTVLLLGETGTGKELIARALHNRSSRKQAVLVKVNCGALPANLVESELFGHERGAFTGAVALKKGRFEFAHRGTIFLDEVGELPLDIQAKLLRVVQEQEFERVGGTQTHKTDVRIIAATNRDLQDEVRQGTFRRDLFYRLNVFPIEVPPLRDRKEDIPLLANYFLQKFSQRMKKRVQSISRGIYDQFFNYDWPGNIRELANVMERAVILCQGETLQPHHAAVSRPREVVAMAESLPTLEDQERRLIVDALQRTGGVLAGPAGAAAMLGINRSTLWSRMRKLGIAARKKGI